MIDPMTMKGRRQRRGPTQLIALTLIWALAVTAGCAPLRQRRAPVQESGFLGDYSLLKKSDEYPAYLVWINPKANWPKYNAVMIDSVSLWGQGEKLSPEDRQKVAGLMYNAVYDAISKHFTIAPAPGLNVLRLRVALTEAKGSIVPLNVVTSVVPQLRVLTTIGGMAADTTALVGEASGELEILDSVTERRLAAAVDRQTGTKALFRANKFSKWGDVKEACDYWAGNIAKFLIKSRVQQKTM